MSRKELKFTDIIEMITKDEVPDGTVFLTPATVGSEDLLEAVYSKDTGLTWDDGGSVRVNKENVSDKWFADEKETEITFIDAMQLLEKGKSVIVDDFWDGRMEVSKYTDIQRISSKLDLDDFGDLMGCTFYKKGIS